MSSNKLNNFDQFLKGKLENQNIPFNESDWDKLEKQLPQKSGKPFWSNPWLWSGAAVIAIVTTSLLMLESENNNLKNDLISNQEASEIVDQPSTQNINRSIDESVTSEKNTTTEESEENNVTPVEIIANEILPDPSSKETINTKAASEPIDNTNVKEDVLPDTDTKVSLTHDSPRKETQHNTVIKPTAEIIVQKSEICQKEQIQFEAKTQENVDYLWSFGDDQFSKDQNPKHQFQNAGSYKVGLTVKSKVDNGILAKSKEILITVNETPAVNFETEEQINLGIPSISFINVSSKGNSWSWNFGDGNISTEKDPNHCYKRKGYYDVSLTSENEFKCSNTISKKVFVENDYNLLAPNSFTPNGDGINDFFIPEALKVMDVEFTMSVFSQNQGLLFETKNINQQWDGINQQTGEKCNTGNYIWVVTLTNKEGKIEQYKGAVLILE